MYHQGQLWFVDSTGTPYEIFNHARTAAYMANAEDAGCGRFRDILPFGGCQAYQWELASGSLVLQENYDLLEFENNDYVVAEDSLPVLSWYLANYQTPKNEAPWYSATFPESEEALGFWIEEWTGLDSSHVRRAAQQLGRRPGGAALGLLSSTERVMRFNVLLVGTSEIGLSYLFRWLDAALMSVCEPCKLNTALLRRYCPDLEKMAIASETPEGLTTEDDDPLANQGAIPIVPIEALEASLARLKRVALVEGLTWEEPPVERAGCWLRRVSFTLAAGDPCMYSEDFVIAENLSIDLLACTSAAGGTFNAAATPCRPACEQLPSDCRIVYPYTPVAVGTTAPRITIRNDSSTGTVPPLAIKAYRGHPVGGSVCGLDLLGEMRLYPIPPDSEIVFDAAQRFITFQDATLADPVPGWAFVEANDPGVTRFFNFACGESTLVIEVDDRCYNVSGSIWTDGLSSFIAINPSIDFVVVERMGCP